MKTKISHGRRIMFYKKKYFDLKESSELDIKYYQKVIKNLKESNNTLMEANKQLDALNTILENERKSNAVHFEEFITELKYVIDQYNR